eukprot:COSAG02_NODE_2807_length_7985_cov_659.432412_8_plen_639_part_00
MASLKLRGIIPHNREEALSMMQDYWRCRMALATTGDNKPKVLELSANMFFGGFAAAMGGVSVVACEIVNWNAQEHIAFTRGAARQFEIPWAVDVSPWFGGSITDYSTSQYWGQNSDPNGGHSLSLYNRSWYTAFMSGAGHLVAEAGAVNLFFQNKSADGVLNLSPLGEVAKDFAHFTHSRLERGIPYAPIAIVLEHAHGFGVSLISLWRGQPTTWNGSFRLSASESIAWALLQALWPGSWFQPANEVLYQVPSPFGDSFDMVLENGNWSGNLAASHYSVAILAGEVQLSGDAAAELTRWVRMGGTVVLFPSQLKGASAAAIQELVGAQLQEGGPKPLPTPIATIVDVEDGWRHNRSAPAPSPFDPKPPTHNGTQSAPFCVQANTAWYIKTGGNASVKEGWDGGRNIDKCCRQSASSCMWFYSAAACTAALTKPNDCLPCSSSSAVNIGCPTWRPPPHPAQPVPNATLIDTLGTATVLLSGESAHGDSPLPVALRNPLDRGTVVTMLLEDAPALVEFGVLSHLLARLSADVSPFEVLSAATGGLDLLGDRLEMMLARASTSWQVTLVNNLGVSKPQREPVVIDASQRVVGLLRMKSRYGTITKASVATEGGRALVVHSGNTLAFTVEPGGVVVLDVFVK